MRVAGFRAGSDTARHFVFRAPTATNKSYDLALTQDETGPHKHNIGQTFFLYFFEPGGNRFELGSGGYLIFDPEWKPIRWNEPDRAKGQAWGLKTIESFRTYGMPPIKR